MAAKLAVPKGFFPRTGSSTAEPRKKPRKSPRPQSNTGNGTVIQAGVTDLGRWLVYALMVLLALGALCGVLAFNRPATPVQQTVASGLTADQQEAGAFAMSYVSAWLSATNDNHDELDEYTQQPTSSLTSKTPVVYRDLAVASVKDAPGDLTSVVVSTSLKSAGKNENGDEVTNWTPYWYQVTVHAKDGAMAPVGLPAPISMPAMGKAPALGYPSQVENTDVRKTVQDFISAYTTGAGDVTRFVSPETTINPITPAYWDRAAVKSLNATADVPNAQPTNGQNAEVLVRVDLSRDGNTKPAQYVLGMKVRDGRWEISSLNSAPALSN